MLFNTNVAHFASKKIGDRLTSVATYKKWLATVFVYFTEMEVKHLLTGDPNDATENQGLLPEVARDILVKSIDKRFLADKGDLDGMTDIQEIMKYCKNRYEEQ